MNNLWEAYKETKYRVFDSPIIIEVGKKCPELDLLLLEQKVQEWAFITAWNPFSKVLSDGENNERHLQLLDMVRQYKCWEGEGIGSDPAWPPERSLLILGILHQEAIEIGKRFKQNAIVYGRINEAAELLRLLML